MDKACPKEMRKACVLIVDDDQDFRWMLAQLMTADGHTVLEADNGEIGVRVLKKSPVDIVLLDLTLPILSGIDVLRRIKERSPAIPVIVITGSGSVESAIQAGRYGASGYLTKPVKNDDVLYTIQLALENHHIHAAPWSTPTSQTAGLALQEIMGSSEAVQKIAAQIGRVAPTDFTVIIMGETGVGKEVVAATIHRESRRDAGPYIAVDCGSIPPTLIESELFGHEKGAFTGADRCRSGCFENAAGGTLFLDEIGNLPMAMQAKLLRALQERQIYRVGGSTPIPLDVRVLAASNEDLASQVEAGQFRRDLYYRLNEFDIRVPPLRERDSDILFLAHRFLHAICEELNKSELDITTDAAQLLRTNSWPGNVRELRNVIRRATLFADSPISCEHLHLAGLLPITPGSIGLAPIAPGSAGHPHFELTDIHSFRELVRMNTDTTEREILVKILDQTKGNMKQAARFLRLDYKTFRTKAKQFGLKPQR